MACIYVRIWTRYYLTIRLLKSGNELRYFMATNYSNNCNIQVTCAKLHTFCTQNSIHLYRRDTHPNTFQWGYQFPSVSSLFKQSCFLLNHPLIRKVIKSVTKSTYFDY